MELVSLVKEVLQNAVEQIASYRIGQSALRYLDRTLWVIEKCAKWAVPPPLDQDEPQPELVRPLPWVFFLMMLVILRITRESISLMNLVLGKPPLRSADVVMYIQSKRRYIRTLKYQGSRMMRARSTPNQNHDSWCSSLRSLFEFTICFKRQSNYGNNNTTRISNNEEILIVKRNKSGEGDASPIASSSEATMERLIERMIVDLNADSEDDASFTLTNVTSEKSEDSESEVTFNDATSIHNNSADDFEHNSITSNDSTTDIDKSRIEMDQSRTESEKQNDIERDEIQPQAEEINPKTHKETRLQDPECISSKKESEDFIQQEKRTQTTERKIGNGRMTKGESDRSGDPMGRRDTDVPVVRITARDNTC